VPLFDENGKAPPEVVREAAGSCGFGRHRSRVEKLGDHAERRHEPDGSTAVHVTPPTVDLKGE